MNKQLWQPSPNRVSDSNIMRFCKFVNSKTDKNLTTYTELHRFSVEEIPLFWELFWDFAEVVSEKKGERIVLDLEKMPGARFFPDSRLNFAQNLLRLRNDRDAIVFRGEDKVQLRVSWAELYDTTSRINSCLLDLGLKPEDRVAAIMPNMPQTIMAMLGAAALGATWSSCSPDFGEKGILDRFSQIDPKVLIVCDGYWYNGKKIDIAEKVEAVVKQLPSVEKIIVVDYLGSAKELADRIEIAETWDHIVSRYEGREIDFVQLPFDHPLYIVFSSGTTGVPKCIVHCAGGVLLMHLKEQVLHGDLNPGDRLFYFTTCGWMMWNWLVSGLASQCTLMLYDGSPFCPNEQVLFDYAQQEEFTLFGTSAKFIDALKKSGFEPIKSHPMPKLKSISSTGSTLVPESYEFVYQGIKSDVHLASMSGGTDICGCFVGGNITAPVFKGEIQTANLGMDIGVWDDEGRPLSADKGELVCSKAFPSMPIGFLNDPDGEKYHSAYFARFDNVWCHGDFAEWTENGGLIIHGRSDATLNPGGVRIGTAEIYAQVEQLPQIIEAIAIGQDWDNDVRIVLFVRLAANMLLDDELCQTIKAKIKQGASPRHVPGKIVAVDDIPRTKSGKITELAVRDVVHGREIKNKEALANPESLELFRDLPELQN